MRTSLAARLPRHLLSPRDWSLRVTLAVALLVPSLLALALSGLRIADQADQAAGFDRVARSATVQGDVETLLQRLHAERLRAAEFVAAGRRGDTAALDATFRDVDASAAAVAPQVTGLYGDDPGLVDADRTARRGLDRLAGLRQLVRTSNAPSSTVLSRYTDLVDAVNQLNDRLLRGINTPETAGLATALSGLSIARNEASLQDAIINVAARERAPAGVALAGLQASDARLVTGLTSFRSALDVGRRVGYAGLIAGPSNGARTELVAVLRSVDPAQPIPANATAGSGQAYSSFLGEIDTARNGLRDELTRTTSDNRSSAIGGAWLNTVLLALALLIGIVIVGLIARRVLRSLRTLRRSALDVAWTRLPEAVRTMRAGAVPDVDVTPVPITSRDELGEVARAFDIVHTEAVRLAAEQASLQVSVNRMFVNLSWRSKSLVDKQLQLIEGLEQNEQDADQLSSLFRLDHLATRMRRNSENLLVLAGTDVINRSSRPVPLVDVLRASVSEIERYERISVEAPPRVVVSGRAANDLQHLFAELLDNATTFSPPDSRVVMTAHRARDGSVVAEIIDSGVGMRGKELDDANAQLSRTSVTSADTGRRMGLLVVGRLASRHGVRVELTSPAEQRGVTASVTIPAHLISGVTVPDQDRRTAARPAPAPSGFPTAPPAVSSIAPSVPAARAATDLPKRVPSVPAVSAAAQPDGAGLFTALTPPGQNGPNGASQNGVADAPVGAVSTPPEVRSSFRGRFTDHESGGRRYYRPVRINWLPDPVTGRIPDDGSDPNATP